VDLTVEDTGLAQSRARAAGKQPAVQFALQRPLRELTDPGNYLRAAPAMVDRVLASLDRGASSDAAAWSRAAGAAPPEIWAINAELPATGARAAPGYWIPSPPTGKQQ